MPAIDVSEKEFEAVASAALEAESIGDMDEAQALDQLARKIKAALSRDHGMANAMAFPKRTYRAS